MNWHDIGLNKYKQSTILFTVLLVLLLQLQDVKVFGVKGGECLGLVVLIISIKKLNVSERILFVFFTFFLLVTISLNMQTDFPNLTYNHLLKMPYLINIARWGEYMSCIGIMVFVRLYLLKKDQNEDLIHLYLLLNVVFSLLILLLFAIELGGWSFFDITYGHKYRLKAFFFEGGPFGLFNAFLGVFSWLYLKGKLKLFALIVFSMMIVLSQSKAGAVCFLIFFASIAFIALFRKCSFGIVYRILLTVLVILVFAAIAHKLLNPYTQTLFDYDLLIAIADEDPNHFWINGGRVPGYYIIKEMIKENPLTGIGIGNYQLLRNSELFRMGFPETQLWDYHGFGGIIDLVVEFGLLGLSCFLLIIYKTFYTSISWLVLVALLPFFLGLPLYFHYPWVMLAILKYSKNMKQ